MKLRIFFFALLSFLTLNFTPIFAQRGKTGIDPRTSIKTFNGLQNSKSDKVGYALITNSDGSLGYHKLDSMGYQKGAESGLSSVANKARLGGTLLADVTIDGNYTNQTTFDKQSQFRVFTGTSNVTYGLLSIQGNAGGNTQFTRFGSFDPTGTFGNLTLRPYNLSTLRQFGRVQSSGILMVDTSTVRLFAGANATPNHLEISNTNYKFYNIKAKTTETNILYVDGSGNLAQGAAPSGGGSDNLGNHTATQALSMANFKITNLGTPTATTDATTKAYVDNAAAVRIYDAGLGFWITQTGPNDVTITSPTQGEFIIGIPTGAYVHKVTFNGNTSSDAKQVSGSSTVDISFSNLSTSGNSAFNGGTGGDGNYNQLPDINVWDFSAPVAFGALNSSSAGVLNASATVHSIISNPSQGLFTFRSQGLPGNFKIVYQF